MGAACVQAAPAVNATEIVVPAESGGLKISIAPTERNEEERVIRLRRGVPQINVVLQNTSDKPMLIHGDSSLSGGFSLMLEVTALDGRVLDAPVQVKRTFMGIVGKLPQPDIIEAGGVLVREVQLNLPDKESDPTNQFGGKDVPIAGYRYSGFPFPPYPRLYGSRIVTMRAVFNSNEPKADGRGAGKPVWTGAIASPTESYRVFWGAD